MYNTPPSSPRREPKVQTRDYEHDIERLVDIWVRKLDNDSHYRRMERLFKINTTPPELVEEGVLSLLTGINDHGWNLFREFNAAHDRLPLWVRRLNNPEFLKSLAESRIRDRDGQSAMPPTRPMYKKSVPKSKPYN